MKGEFIDHAQQTHETTAQLCNVERAQDTYKKPIPPQTKHAFYGIDPKNQSEVVAQQAFAKNSAAFYSNGVEEAPTRLKPAQTEDQAMKLFFGSDDNEKKPEKFGNPIPGYSGVSRRVVADNVFGMTYAEANRRAMESQSRITNEKGDTLKMTSKYNPNYGTKTGNQFGAY